MWSFLFLRCRNDSLYRSEYFNYLVASSNLVPFLKDNGEQKRIGTLVVFVDNGVATNTPILAIPINLSLVVGMPDDRAFVGFTSSTGRFYEKHDIISWMWCDQSQCDENAKKNFDYYQSSAFSTAQTQYFDPGAGYGGGASDHFPLKNQSPDTTSISVPIEHFAADRNIGLASDSVLQVPPKTLY